MSEVTPIRPDLPVPEDLRYCDTLDERRDLRDALVLSAICAAIRLIVHNEEDLAADVLRLGRERLEAALA
jgi:hypothetical protein